MTEETKPTETQEAEDTRTPMERAVAGGYKEEGEPSREDRVTKLVHDMEHAARHNAPIGHAMLREMRELLGVNEDKAEEAEQSADGEGA